VKSSSFFMLLFAICVASLILARTPAHAQKEVTPDRLPFPQADDRFDTILQMHSKAATATRIDPNQLEREAGNCWSSHNPCSPTCSTWSKVYCRKTRLKN
jgi:hypothetical protein